MRGSAAGSFVLYCLGATDVNPVEYRIPFERLLNIERREMPDIDMDFQDDRREEVLNYVVSRYGTDHVAQIITFGTLKAKAAIRDVGRALAMPYPEVDRIARLVPPTLNITLESAIAETPELKEVYEADESVRKLVDTARSLEGITRHPSTHAAGWSYPTPVRHVRALAKTDQGRRKQHIHDPVCDGPRGSPWAPEDGPSWAW